MCHIALWNLLIATGVFCRNAKNKLTGESMSQLDVAASMYTMIAAGYETTATAVSYTMYCLARYQDLQERVHQVGACFWSNRLVFITSSTTV